MRRGVPTALFAIGLALSLWCGPAQARSADEDGFPDYQRLEYATPLPPPDQQAKPRAPGAIDLKVGTPRVEHDMPLDALPVRVIGRASSADDSEPSMSGMFEETKVSESTSSAGAAHAANTVLPAKKP